MKNFLEVIFEPLSNNEVLELRTEASRLFRNFFINERRFIFLSENGKGLLEELKKLSLMENKGIYQINFKTNIRWFSILLEEKDWFNPYSDLSNLSQDRKSLEIIYQRFSLSSIFRKEDREDHLFYTFVFQTRRERINFNTIKEYIDYFHLGENLEKSLEKKLSSLSLDKAGLNSILPIYSQEKEISLITYQNSLGKEYENVIKGIVKENFNLIYYSSKEDGRIIFLFSYYNHLLPHIERIKEIYSSIIKIKVDNFLIGLRNNINIRRRIIESQTWNDLEGSIRSTITCLKELFLWENIEDFITIDRKFDILSSTIERVRLDRSFLLFFLLKKLINLEGLPSYLSLDLMNTPLGNISYLNLSVFRSYLKEDPYSSSFLVIEKVLSILLILNSGIVVEGKRDPLFLKRRMDTIIKLLLSSEEEISLDYLTKTLILLLKERKIVEQENRKLFQDFLNLFTLRVFFLQRKISNIQIELFFRRNDFYHLITNIEMESSGYSLIISIRKRIINLKFFDYIPNAEMIEEAFLQRKLDPKEVSKQILSEASSIEWILDNVKVIEASENRKRELSQKMIHFLKLSEIVTL